MCGARFGESFINDHQRRENTEIKCADYLVMKVLRFHYNLRHHLTIASLAGIIAAVLAAVVLALPWTGFIDVGHTSQDYPYIRSFHTWEYSEYFDVRFRWSYPDATLLLPGAGTLAPLELRVYSDTPGVYTTLNTGGDGSPSSVALRQGWQRLLLLPQPDRWNDDVALHFSTPTQTSATDGRKRGIAIDWIRLHGVPASPAPAQPLFIGISVALASVLTGWCTRRAWANIAVGCLLIAGSVVVLLARGGAWHLMLTSFSGRLALVLVAGAVLAFVLHRVLVLVSGRGGISRKGTKTQRPGKEPDSVYALVGVALVAFVLRAGLMSYPLNYIIDLKYHFGRAVMVRSGHFLDLFLPNPMVTPVQWDPALIVPYAPLYYLLNAPLSYLPQPSGYVAMILFSSGVDALAVLCITLLVKQAGASQRAAIIAALLASAMPFGLLMVASWGHLPTLLGQCLMLATMLAWLRLRDRLHERRVQVGITALMTLAFLSYTLVPMFLGITWVFFLVLLALRRDHATVPLLWSGLLAAAIAVALFYGWHIPPLLNKTLPALLHTAAPSDTHSHVPVAHLVQAIWQPVAAQFNPLVLTSAGSGAVLLAVGTKKPAAHLVDMRLLCLAWVATYPFLALASTFMMTFNWKDVLYILPLVSILAGLFLGKLTQRRGGGIIAGAIVLLVFWYGMDLMVHQIVHAYTDLK